MTVLEKIKELKPLWGNDPLLVWDEALLKKVSPFVTDIYQSNNESVNAYSIIGSDNKEHLGKTWNQLLDQAKNIEQLVSQYELRKHFFYSADATENNVRIVSMDGIRWFVQGDAIYDVALSRFDLIGSPKSMLHGVTKEDVRVDWTMFRYYTTLQGLLKHHRLGMKLSAENLVRSVTEHGGFIHTTFHVLVSLEHEDGRSQNLARMQVEEMIGSFAEKNGMFDKLLRVRSL